MNEGYYPRVPKTMEEVVKELFNPPQTYKPFFTGYEPQFYFRTVNRCDTKPLTEYERKLLFGSEEDGEKPFQIL